MEPDISTNEKLTRVFLLISSGLLILFSCIPFLSGPPILRSYASTDQLFQNGLYATLVYSVYIMILVGTILIINFSAKAWRARSINVILGSALMAGFITFFVTIFSVHFISTLITIPGGIDIRFSDFEPLSFLVGSSFLSTVMTFILLAVDGVVKTAKYLVILLLVAAVICFAGLKRINQKSIVLESQYVLEQCVTLARGTVERSGLTSIGTELLTLGKPVEETKKQDILTTFGRRCRQISPEAFDLFSYRLSALSLSRGSDFGSSIQIERDNFIKTINSL